MLTAEGRGETKVDYWEVKLNNCLVFGLMEAEETEGSREVKAVFLAEMNNIIIPAFHNKSKFTKHLLKHITLNMSLLSLCFTASSANLLWIFFFLDKDSNLYVNQV